MKGAALGLSWEIVARIRSLFYASVAYFAVACAVVALVPTAWRVPALGVGLASPLLLLAIGIANAMSFSEGADLRTRRGGYTRRLLTMPASSFTLASVPLLLGSALLALVWLVVAMGLLHPCGADAPLVMTALALVTTVAFVQALTWTPFPIPWLRGVLLGIGCYAVLGGPFVLESFGIDRWLLCSALAGLFVTCYAVALVGVRLGRRGVWAGDAVRVDREEVREVAAPLAPFSSPLRAQMWLEARFLGWVTFWQTLVMVLGFLPLLHFLEVAWSKPFMLAAMGPLAERLGVGWMSASVLLLLPVAFSAIGGDVSRQSTPGKAGLSQFYATRAVGIPDLIKAKLLAMAGFVVVLWGQLAALALGWAAVRGLLSDMLRSLADVAGLPGLGVAVLAAGFVVCCAFNWLWIVGSQWIGLTGRPWVTAVVVPGVTVICVAMLLGKDWQPSWHPWLVALVCLGLAGKAVVVGWACRRLVDRDYARASTLAALLSGWAVAVTGLAAAAAWLFPGGWLTFAAVVLLTPLATSLFAPLALAWDRHR